MEKSQNVQNTNPSSGVIAPELPAPIEPTVRAEEDRSRTPRPVKRYRYRFSPLLFMLLIAALALCVVCFALTTWFFSDYLVNGNLSVLLEWLKYFILYAASVGVGAFIVSVLACSEYLLSDDALTVRLGFFRSRTPLEKIHSVHHFRGANKLVAYFDSVKTDYLIIVIKESYYGDFVRELTLRNERIYFPFSTPEEEESIKKK